MKPGPAHYRVRDRSPRGRPWVALALTLLIGTKAVAATPAALAPRLTDLQGRAVSLDSYRGRVVLVNFWASWCAPCRQEMPALDRLYRALDPRRALIVGVAADERPAVESFAAKLGIHYPIVIGDPEQIFVWSESLGNVTQGLPFSALIDPDGTIRWGKSGDVNVSDVKHRIEELLKSRSHGH